MGRTQIDKLNRIEKKGRIEIGRERIGKGRGKEQKQTPKKQKQKAKQKRKEQNRTEQSGDTVDQTRIGQNRLERQIGIGRLARLAREAI